MSNLLRLVENVLSDAPERGALFPRLFVPRGEVVFRQDDPGDCLYVVRSGRLRVFREPSSGPARVLGEVGLGECIGEMALLAGGVRGATAVAIRDTELIRVSQRDFETLGERHPRTMMEIMRVIAQRLDRSNQGARPVFPRFTIALLPLGANAPLDWFYQCLGEGLSSMTSARLAGPETIPDRFHAALQSHGGGADPQLAGWMSELEHECDCLLLRGSFEAGSWNRQILRQADVILLVADAAAPGNLAEAGLEIERICPPATRPRVELVLVHPTFPCLRTNGLLESRVIDRHHHVRRGARPDVDRVARILTGRDVTLVLGGGGARGFGEVGVIRALTELGVPIDRVCGTSMGAVIGAHYALFQDWQRTRNDLHREFVVKGRLNDYTFPLQSMILGRRYEILLENLFADTRIEDFPLGFFAMSCNLTCAASVAHRRGLAWKWLSASISIPGMAPPLIHGGELFIDGGILNNLPVDVAREDGAGYVIAVDASPEVDLKVDGSFEGRPGAFKVLQTWMASKNGATRYPSLFDVLLRTTELSSINNKNSVRKMADCYLRLPVQHFLMFDWPRIDQLIELGYRSAIETLQPIRSSMPALNLNQA